MKVTPKNPLFYSLFLSLALFSAGSASADVLLSWERGSNFSGTGVNKSWETNFSAPNLNTATIIAGEGINADTDDWNSTQFRYFRPQSLVAGSGTIEQSIEEGDYFTFTLTPQSGYMVSVDSFSIFGGTGNGTVTLQLRSSLDGFASSLGQISVASSSGSLLRAWTLPGTTHDNLTSSVEFRLYGFSTASAGHTLRVDTYSSGPEITLNGTVAVIPEPVTVLLAVLVGSAVIITRRRRCK